MDTQNETMPGPTQHEEHIRKSAPDEPTDEELKRWAIRGVLKWLFIFTAVAAGVWVGAVMFL